MRIVPLIALAAFVSSCRHDATVPVGTWRGVIEMQGKELPFNFDLTADSGRYTAQLKNGAEELLLDEVKVTSDSIDIALHIFDANLKARIKGGRMDGYFVKNFETDYRLPFHATQGDAWRFAPDDAQSPNDFSGKFAVTFIDGRDTIPSVGIFRQQGTHVTGTFLKTDGDYRYLEGNVVGGKMWLSTFDGHHLYIFSAEKTGDSLSGDYWSGKAHHETWTATKDPMAALPDVESLNHLKKGYDRLDFSFPDLNGKKISPTDPRYANKVLILQIFGTWCPNCMDETKFLARWYKKNRDRGVEILALAYERKADFAYAASRIEKMKAKLDVDYDFVIAGTSDKAAASKTLPALDRVLAFPTTIFIGRDGKVKRIHTGFSGPGTGAYYEEFIQHFNETVNELLGENLASR